MKAVRTLAFACAITLLSACSSAVAPRPASEYQGLQFFTCCNLRPSDGAVSDANWYESSSVYGTPNEILPYGTRVQVVEVGRGFFTLRTATGSLIRVTIDYGSDQVDGYIEKLLRRDDPHRLVASYPAGIQRAIAEGRVEFGMTKEQVLIALGYPPSDRTKSIAADLWTYRRNRYVAYELLFDGAGYLHSMSGHLPTAFGGGSLPARE